jgi:hypothetical protein
MNISIPLTLDAEQSAALDMLVAEYNSGNQSADLSAKEYLALVLTNSINDKVARNFENAVRRLGDAAKALPYEQRLALIAQVESQIPK